MAQTFGQRVKQLRLTFAYSQRELAKLIGTSAGLISFIERDRNRPNYEIVRRLASVFNTTTDFLINGEGTAVDELLDVVKKDMQETNPKQLRDLEGKISKLNAEDKAILSEILSHLSK